MKKSYELAKKVIIEINDYQEKYTSFEGKHIITDDAIKVLDKIIHDGLILYKRVIDKKVYVGKPEIISILNDMNKLLEKLQINEENAKNVNLSSGLQLWEQLKVMIALLASYVMDYQESLN